MVEKYLDFGTTSVTISGLKYHGRYGSQTLSKDTAILWSHNLDTAKDYAGNNGSVWKLTNEDILLDAEIVIDHVQQRLEEIENTPEWFRNLEYSDLGLINPSNIVDSAGWWDNTDFVGWFCEEYPDILGILTEDGAVTLSPEAGNPKKIKA